MIYQLYTIKQFIEAIPAFTEGGVRHRIFHSQENGLAESGAIVRDGRKILINPEKWFSWLENSQ